MDQLEFLYHKPEELFLYPHLNSQELDVTLYHEFVKDMRSKDIEKREQGDVGACIVGVEVAKSLQKRLDGLEDYELSAIEEDLSI